jgi:uncharacterized protein involved in exopolysaccharide biosynthesis
MSFTTNKRDGATQPAVTLQLARSTTAPAFKPQILRSVRMHPRLALGVGALVLVALLGYATTQKSTYQAISQVYEDPVSPKLLGDSGAIFDANKYDAFLGEQIQLVQRMDVLKAALATLPQTTWAEYGATVDQAADALQTQLKVQRLATSYQISISLKGSDPARTADVVNAVTTAYLAAVHKANAEESDVRGQLLAEERQRIESELRAARSEQAALGASIGVANPAGEGGNPYDAELSGIRAQLTEARAAHDVAAAQLASLSGVGPSQMSGLKAAADEAIAGDAGLGSMKATVSARKAQLNGQMTSMTPGNPIYKQDQDEMADLDRTLDRMTAELRDKAERRMQDKLRTDLERTGDVEARLNGELARQIATATSAAPKLQRASEVGTDILRLQTREAAVDDAIRGLRLDSTGPTQVRLSLAASPPEHPEASRRKLLLLAALPLALCCGAFAAVLARKQDTRIYGGIDVQDLIGFPPLAILPARADVPAQVYEEYVLRLAAGIESAYRTSGARTFLLTAVSLTTDIDPLASALTRKFEDIGVNVVVATAGDMLAPGEGAKRDSKRRSPSEMAKLAEARSKGFVAANVARMKNEHGLVLIESDALLNSAQTEYVARCADATVLVVECGVTTRHELFCAAELLERLHVTGIGAVMEEMQLRFADSGYREAISALERRQAAAPRNTGRGAAPETIEEAPALTNVRQPEVETRQPEHLSPAETVESGPQPYDGVLQQMTSRPAAKDEWELPMMASMPAVIASETVPVVGEAEAETEVKAAAETAEPVTVRRGFAGDAARGPVLVGTQVEVESVPQNEEIAEEEPLIAMATGTLHEKMTPMLSGRREALSAAGDSGMIGTKSWLDRLLKRDAPSRIVPGDEDDDSAAGEPVMSSGARSSKSVKAREDYDLPLATRLDQISRSRPVAPASATKSSSRLQIVPQEEPFEIVVPARSPLLDTAQEPEEIAAPVAEPVPEVALAEPAPAVMVEEPIAVEPEHPAREPVHEFAAESAPTAAIVEEPIAVAVEPPVTEPVHEFATESAPAVAMVEEPIGVEAEPPVTEPVAAAAPVVEAAKPPGPGRPLSFQELNELAQQREPPRVAAHVALPMPEPVAEPLAHAEVAAPPTQAIAAIPVVEAAQEIEPQVHLAPPVRHDEEVAPVVEHVAAAQVAPALALVAEVDNQWGAATYDPARVSEEAGVAEARWHEYPAQYEADDIKPVYEEASRHLTTGRWDPIPTLRPDQNGWRERPSPIPPTHPYPNGSEPRWTGAEEDHDAWAASLAYRTEPLPEPLLTRQWGLLSKFQQSRIGSGQHPIAKTGEDDQPGSKKGNR